jgi:YHS domain-containing protein
MRILLSALLAAGLWATPEAEKKQGKSEAVKDPVCGMTVHPKQAAAKSEYKGKTYYFCSREEKKDFDQNPEKYLSKK